MRNMINDLITPIGAFIKLKDFNPVFLFESVEKYGSSGRYSFIGLDPMETLVFDRRKSSETKFIEKMRSALKDIPALLDTNRRFPAGLVGMTSFEMFGEFEGLQNVPLQDNGHHDAAYIVPRIVVLFDHQNHSFTVLQTDREEADENLVKEILKALRSEHSLPSSQTSYSQPAVSVTKDELKDQVLKVQDHINAGELYQMVLSARYSGETDMDPFQIYRALRHKYPSPYLYYLKLDGMHVLGSSPESLVRLERGNMRLQPISGFRSREDKRAIDNATAESLTADELENAKHVVLFDQAKNDCAKVCDQPSVSVGDFRTIEHHSHEMNLKSSITGKMAADKDIFDVYRAAFPAATASGVPKSRAAELISEFETVPRGAYGGSVGYFAVNGTMDHAIIVRTMVIQNNVYSTQAGLIITSDSVPEVDAETIITKGQGLVQTLEVARECL